MNNRRFLLLLVVTLVILVSGDARSTAAGHLKIQVTKPSLSGGGHALQTDKRALRGVESTTAAVKEERGLPTAVS
ncbi:hypothetical protein PHYSODRAFT_356076 [Phytophthora sojae]|uniref:RxLR effector protein n=1 Tax=Phytophthora sojae (strain P6497) TaxID=1094619 RepID=G5ABI9_PHYSP|nr:hypothetical protein PHYSODRAFT_356076 [Phytophthora sojae]EGZ06714.1 hypothetical protein PHYSODRAFT_356076 [Phytophthora sojae]|eukprot:XP_009537478.1 hypothetical protein PHYSODRAFT_356076 [Phytophthora sojae]